MKKQTKTAFLIMALAAMFSACKKNDTLNSDAGILSKDNSTLIAGDGKWDLLGHGFDITGELFERKNTSKVSIINVDQFFADYPTRIPTPTDTKGDYNVYYGATAYDYVKDVNNKQTFGLTANAGNPKGDTLYGTANFSLTNDKQNTYTYSSKYSYASYESWYRIKSIDFTDDVTPELLTNYLTPDFIAYVSSHSAEDVVGTYGTHILLGIDIGGRLKYDYKGAVIKEINYDRKLRNIKAGFSIGIEKIFGINLSTDLNKEEKTTISNETTDKLFTGTFYGGNNSGTSFTGDAQGNVSTNINLVSWQQSINVYNASLIGINRSAPIYDFVTDPVKKAQIKAVVEKRIIDRQIKELGEVPVYAYRNSTNGDRYFTPEDKPFIGNDVNFRKEGISFYAFSKSAEWAVPIFAYRNSRNGDRYFTPEDKAYIGNDVNFRKEGIAFYAYSTPNERSIPVYAYRNSTNGDRYFTPEDKPFIGNDVNFRKEGIAFYGVK